MASKVPPNNLEAEQSVLGGVFVQAGILEDLAGILKADDFYSPVHQTIYQAMLVQFQGNNPLDMVSISNRLSAQKKLEEIGGPSYLTSLTESVVSPTTSLAHAEIVKDKSIRRSLINSAQTIQNEAWSSIEDTGTILDTAQHAITELALNTQQGEAEKVGDTLFRVFENLESTDADLGRISTGYHRIDAVMGGLTNTNLIILAARPRMGKTALAGNILGRVALSGMPSGFFSLEMSREQIVQRMLSATSKVQHQDIKDRNHDRIDWNALQAAAEKLYTAPLFIDDSPKLTIYEIRSRARKMQKKHGIRFLVVDYLTKIRPSQKRETRDQEVTDIATDLKALARELNIPVLCLAQLNRACEQRTNKRPQLSDLRESGGIEQEADDILFLYRDEVYNAKQDNPERGVAEIHIAKQRNGPEGLARIKFFGETMRFENLVNVSEFA